MKKVILVLLGTLFLSAPAFAKEGKGRKVASNASSVEYLKGAVKKSEFVRQIMAHAKKVAENKAKCGELDIAANKHDGTVIVRGSCNLNEPDNEFSVLFEIKGIVYDGSDDLMIENVKFDYAG